MQQLPRQLACVLIGRFRFTRDPLGQIRSRHSQGRFLGIQGKPVDREYLNLMLHVCMVTRAEYVTSQRGNENCGKVRDRRDGRVQPDQMAAELNREEMR